MPTPPARSDRGAARGGRRPEGRNQGLLLGIGLVVAISVVIAGLVILSSGGGEPEQPDGPPAAAVEGTALVLGPADAPRSVVVEESFGSPAARSFDVASRDFLQIMAARGDLRVEYRPRAGSSGYAASAYEEWTGALGSSDPARMLVLHDRLMDEQPPDTTGGADTGPLPTVTVDGTPVVADDGTALAERLQQLILEG